MGSLEQSLRDRIAQKVIEGDRKGLDDILDEVNLEGSHERNEAAAEFILEAEAKKKEWEAAEEQVKNEMLEKQVAGMGGDVLEKTKDVDQRILEVKEGVKEDIKNIEANSNIDHKVDPELEPGLAAAKIQSPESEVVKKEYSTLTTEQKVTLLDSLGTKSREELLKIVEEFPYSYSSENRGFLAEVISKGKEFTTEDLLEIKNTVNEGGKYNDEMIMSAVIKTEKLPLEEVKKILQEGGGSFTQRAFMETQQYKNLSQEDKEKFVGDLAKAQVA